MSEEESEVKKKVFRRLFRTDTKWKCSNCCSGYMHRHEEKDRPMENFDTGIWECWKCDECGYEQYEAFD